MSSDAKEYQIPRVEKLGARVMVSVVLGVKWLSGVSYGG
jgi:hypothetical protein